MSAVATTALPSGIVTFVFTDIEGSTRLIHRVGERYVDVLERHRQILRRAWEAHGGHEMSAEGDAFFVAFSNAAAAIAACVDAQRGLAAERWPDDIELSVRMGVHSGLASPQDGDYVTLAVHQAARVVAAGHGGQVLVSQATVDALGSRDAAELEFLGRFRLRDFEGPVELYQVGGLGDVQDRPVRAVPADQHNLVRQPTETIGREELMSGLTGALVPGRLITLVGPGGVGKTRVAAEVGLRSAPRWEDGVWFVDLADVGEPELVVPAVAAAVNAPNRPGRQRRDDLLEHLAPRRTVVILDNCEHVLRACAELVSAILAACDGVAMLATSREALHVPTETVRHVEPLDVPNEDDVRPEDVLATPAGRLFVERGLAVRPGFEVTPDNAADVAGICRHLDGLPLLLELAAAHLSALSPAEILAGLEDRFRLLRSPSPLVSDRHRTVDGLLGWSYDLLSDDERAAFRRLSVFGGGFTLDAAAIAISREGGAGEAAHLVWTLVNRSLVTADLRAEGTRYRFLETLRTYGRRMLDEAGEVGAVAVRLARSYLDQLGPWHQADRRWVGAVGAELDNLRALIPMLPPEEVELAQQLACSVGLHHDAVQSYRDGIPELERYVRDLDHPSATRVSLLCALAYLHLRTGEVAPATELVDEAERVQEAHGAPPWDDVAIERTRGEIARRSGDLERAVAIARRGLERPLSDRGRSRLWNLLGTTSAALGDLEAAYEACSAELDLNRVLGDDAYVASAHGNLAEVALRLGDVPTAASHQRACLELGMAHGSTVMVAFSLIVAGRIAGTREEWTTAAVLHARGEALLEEIGLELYEDDRVESDELLGRIRTELGDERAEQAQREGFDLDIAAAVRMAADALAGAGAGAEQRGTTRTR